MHYSTLAHLPFSVIDGKQLEENVLYPQDHHDFIRGMAEVLKMMNSNTLDGYIWRAVSEAMEPFCCETTRKEFLEFDDHTQELKKDYETGMCDCFKLPQGVIVPINAWSMREYTIRNGKAYALKAGPLQHTKHTKKSRKLKALPNYPLKKRFKTLKEYAENEGYSYFEEEDKFGQFFNPNSFFDWFAVGGRWPQMFLVKKECPYQIYGDRILYLGDDSKTPEGYVWVCGARKCDIEWDVMRAMVTNQLEENFLEYQKIFKHGTIPEGSGIQIKDDGLYVNFQRVYLPTDTFESFLLARNINVKRKMFLNVYAVFYEREYVTVNDYENAEQWYDKLEEYFEELPEDEFIIGVDCHM